jgi:hypothetical protein
MMGLARINPEYSGVFLLNGGDLLRYYCDWGGARCGANYLRADSASLTRAIINSTDSASLTFGCVASDSHGYRNERDPIALENAFDSADARQRPHMLGLKFD